jgi:uncharacterized FlaG/YvyC family protein
MSVFDMKQRFAQAQEKVTYAETIGPDSTTKLPPVSKRIYHDKDGNIINPEESIDHLVSKIKNEASLPVIGNNNDPYMTMPIQKVVSDEGEVLTGSDSEVKTYIQPEYRKKGLSARTKAIISLVVVFVLIALVAVGLRSAGVLKTQELSETTQTETQASQDDESAINTERIRQINIYKDLASNYSALANYRQQVNAIASSFNSSYTSSNKDTRQKYADECSALITSVTDAKTALIDDMNNLSLASDNEYFESYEQINTLYELLLNRLQVIQSCWEVSLSYEKPKDHSAEILAGLSQDIKQGKSASMAQFDSIYEQVSITEPANS